MESFSFISPSPETSLWFDGLLAPTLEPFDVFIFDYGGYCVPVGVCFSVVSRLWHVNAK